MSQPPSRPTRSAILAILLVALAACAAPRGDTVRSCPHCGDPLTRVGADGRAEVVTRLRIGSWSPSNAPAPGHAAR